MAKVWKCPRCGNRIQAASLPSSFARLPFCGNDHWPDHVLMELVEIHDRRDCIDDCIQAYRDYLRGTRHYPYMDEFPSLSETEIRNCFNAARVSKPHLTDA